MDNEDFDPRDDFTIVYPVSIRQRFDLKQPLNHMSEEDIFVADVLVYVASSEQTAHDWCKRNTDVQDRDEPERPWWFVVTQEAIDGDYSGVKGLVAMYDWDGNPLWYSPINGYKAQEKTEEQTSETGN